MERKENRNVERPCLLRIEVRFPHVGPCKKQFIVGSSLPCKVLPINRGSPPLWSLDTGGGGEEAEIETSWHGRWHRRSVVSEEEVVLLYRRIERKSSFKLLALHLIDWTKKETDGRDL